MFDVIIPARNEAPTIGAIVGAFRRHRRINRIIVPIDVDTTDLTALDAQLAGATTVTGSRGKGQTVRQALPFVTTPYVIFCDADYKNLSRWHISRMCSMSRYDVQLIGEPDIPSNYPPSKEWAWPWVSGFRRVPTAVAQAVDLHGYNMEVQLNNACQTAGVPTMITRLRGLVSPYEMTERRQAERDRDYEWGVKNGVLPKPTKPTVPPPVTDQEHHPSSPSSQCDGQTGACAPGNSTPPRTDSP